jgi:hypothetical protein
MEDWHSVSYDQLSKYGGGSLLNKFGGILELMKHCFPDYPWDPKKYAVGMNWGKTQSRLLNIIHEIFQSQNVEILSDAV